MRGLLTFIIISLLVYCRTICVFGKYCPDFETVDLNLTEFGGVWHEIARYPNELQNSNCVSYELVPKETEILARPVTSRNLAEDSPNYIVSRSHVAPGAAKRGKLVHELRIGGSNTISHLTEYVLAVDYHKYYISYGCYYDENTANIKEFAWIVTRSKSVDVEVLASVNNYLNSSKIIDINRLVFLNLNDKSC